jgi:hypothetical protein
MFGSTIFHVVVLGVASLVAVGLALPRADEEPRALRGEFGPADNRAKEPSRSAGGGPGELGGEAPLESVRIAADGRAERGAARDAEADALLAEALPAPTAADPNERALPGPLLTGPGVLPGPGAGGGGGSGGGSGGGVGKGVGPGTEFFGAREQATSFVYLIDRSGSMADHAALDVAKRELIASLTQLPPDVKVGVILYNQATVVLPDATGRPGMMPANAANKARLRSLLARIDPNDNTDQMVALRRALDLHPEVVFFLTDAQGMTNHDAESIADEAGPTRIQCIEFGIGPDPGISNPLRKLAIATNGSYRYIDVQNFPATRVTR